MTDLDAARAAVLARMRAASIRQGPEPLTPEKASILMAWERDDTAALAAFERAAKKAALCDYRLHHDGDIPHGPDCAACNCLRELEAEG